MGILSYKGTEFYMDEKPYRILSGAIHYFRVVPEYWEDRLKKLKSCGLNTVETYVCWNLHERKEGIFDFDGMLDLERYICIAESLGLNIILRPGPYICTEWDMGGLPSWLLTYRGMRLRCYDALFLDKVKKYLDEVCKRVKIIGVNPSRRLVFEDVLLQQNIMMVFVYGILLIQNTP